MAHIPYGYKIKTGLHLLTKQSRASQDAFEEYAGGLSLEGAANKAGIPAGMLRLEKCFPTSGILATDFILPLSVQTF